MEAILLPLSKLGFDWPVALANLINFLLIFFILRKFAWQPILSIIAERERLSREGLEHAKRAEAELLVASEKARGLIDQAKSEARTIVQGAREEEKNIVDKAEVLATGLAEEHLREARDVLAEEKRQVMREVADHATRLITLGTKKVLGRDIKPDIDKKFIDSVLSR